MAGIYIHIPFCKKACHYCNFHFSTNLKHIDSLIATICKEISLRKDYLVTNEISSIYFGGGTPSLLTENHFHQIFEKLAEIYTWSENTEITLEANPDDINKESIETWKKFGINRLSIGIQSFFDDDLRWMNRAHDSTQAFQCIKMARSSGIEKISADLIYGIPNTSLTKWQQNVEQLVSLAPNHISSYCLTVEPSTALAHFIKKGKVIPMEDEESAKQFLWGSNYLETEGYDHYEISNFARNSDFAIHNTSYWINQEYIGIGPSAHSFNRSSRQWNVANNAKFIKSIQENKPFYESEILTNFDKYNEHIMTGLRTKNGVNVKYIESIGSQFLNAFNEELNLKKWSSYLIINGSNIRLTKEGWLCSDRIASDFFLTNQGN